MGINRVCVSGNLTRDAELRSTQSGLPVLSLGVAVNDRRKNAQTGEWEDCPNFVDCTMFGERAAKIAQYLAKGTKVAVDGRLRYSSWTDSQGGKRSKLEVVVEDIEFLSPRSQPQQQPQQPYQQPQMQNGYYAPPRQQQAPQQPQYAQPQQYQQPQMAMPMQQPAADTSLYDDDIPF